VKRTDDQQYMHFINLASLSDASSEGKENVWIMKLKGRQVENIGGGVWSV
jgi:hypothetical protein